MSFLARVSRRARIVAVGTLVVAAVAGSAAAAVLGSGGGLPVTVTATPTTGLADGQSVSVHVDAQSPPNSTASAIYGVEARQCPSGQSISFAADFNPTQTGKCALHALSALGDAKTAVAVPPPYATADLSFRVGKGADTYTTQGGSTVTVTCDETHPCDLVVKLQVPNDTRFASFALSWVRTASAPGAPTGVTAVAGDGVATVSWAPPASDGGASVSSYTATASPGGGTCTAVAPSAVCTVGGLTNGTAYTFTVTATNSAGTGAPSAPSAAVTPLHTGPAPEALPVTVAATPTSGLADGQAIAIHVDAQSPPNAVPSAIYGVDARVCAAAAIVAFPADFNPTQTGKCALHALSVGSDATASVAVAPPYATADLVYRAGEGTDTYTTQDGRSVSLGCGRGNACKLVVKLQVPGAVRFATFALSFTDDPGVPGPPSAVAAVATDASATVSWTAPPTNGGPAVQTYVATSAPGAKTCVATAPLSSCTVTGLANGTAYTFTVRATNAVGTGPSSVPSSAVTPQAPQPSPDPTKVTATVAASPTQGVRDGQTVAITVKTTTDYPVYGAEAQVCRPGVSYSTSVAVRPAPDFGLGGANCPLTPLSSSADTTAVDNATLANAAAPAGETFTLRVGTGVAPSSALGGAPALTCDADHPCALVVEIRVGPGTPIWIPKVLALTYHVDDPLAGCGGTADGVLATGGPDRLSDAWVAWTTSVCSKGGGVKAPTRASFAGEGEALASFGSGDLDLAYTSLGYDDGALIAAPSDGSGLRPAVKVPVALDATVLAVGNGRRGANGKKVPYSDVKLTLREVAALVSGGTYGMGPYLDAIYARNPELALTGFFDTSSAFQVGGVATTDSTTYQLTKLLHDSVPEVWKVPDQPGVFESAAGLARGVTASFATADPPFTHALDLFSGRPALQRNLVGLGGSDFGGIWAVTDLSTARALGLTPVAIDGGDGNFVTPTAASLSAAVGTGGDATGGARPYPLTFVESALAPAQPLVSSSCALRSTSQSLLGSWLRYLTSDAQAQLPDGLVPLTSGLKAQASSAIDTVGAAPLTGPCAAAPATTTPSTSTTTATAAPDQAPAAESPATSDGLAASDGPAGGGAAISAGASSHGLAAPASPTTQEPDPGIAKAAVSSGEPTRALAPRHISRLVSPGRAMAMAALGGVLLFTFAAIALTSKTSSAVPWRWPRGRGSG